MILAVDIGNTNIVIGVIDGKDILFTERLSTNHLKTEMEYANDLRTIFEICDIDKEKIEGGIIASVVPQITSIMKLAIQKLFTFRPLIVGPGIKTGINIRLDNPSEMGSDRVADAVAAINEYQAPIIIVDMGTANTISVIDKNKNVIGGLLMPGVLVSLDALTASASQLNGISIEKPKDIIGKNTKDCMKSGVIYGQAAMIDGLVDRIEARIEDKATVIVTGGLSKVIVPFCEHEVIHDEDLLLKGLRTIYDMNTRA